MRSNTAVDRQRHNVTIRVREGITGVGTVGAARAVAARRMDGRMGRYIVSRVSLMVGLRILDGETLGLSECEIGELTRDP